MRGDVIITQPASVPVGEMTEEEQLSLTFKASLKMALKEQAARVGSFIYDRALGDLPISIFHFLFFFYSIIHNNPNICIFTMSVCGLLPGEMSGSLEIPGEVMKSDSC